MRTKSQAAFIRRTLARLAERGLSGRDLHLMEIAQEAVDAEFSDVFMRLTQPRDRQTRKGAIDSYQELLTERDFGQGMAEDLWAVCEKYGFPRPSASERHRLPQFWCFIGRQSSEYEREGV